MIQINRNIMIRSIAFRILSGIFFVYFIYSLNIIFYSSTIVALGFDGKFIGNFTRDELLWIYYYLKSLPLVGVIVFTGIDVIIFIRKKTKWYPPIIIFIILLLVVRLDLDDWFKSIYFLPISKGMNHNIVWGACYSIVSFVLFYFIYRNHSYQKIE